MTQDVKDGDQLDPMAKAVANGYKEPSEPSREDRAVAAITALEHSVKHNAPVAMEVIRDLRDLLGVAEKVIEEAQGDQAA